MRLLLVFISINVFCQPPAKNLMSKGQMNATQFLLSTFGDEDFKKHIRVDTARNSMTFFKDGEFLRLSQTTQTDEKILGLNFRYTVTDETQTIYSFDIETNNDGVVTQSKKSIKYLRPYLDLANGLVPIDLDKAKEIAKTNGLSLDKCSWTLDKKQGKLI